MVLIVAPAGYGKTTFAIQWAEFLTTRRADLALTNEHNTPDRFLQGLMRAIGIEPPGSPSLDTALEAIDQFAKGISRSVLIIDDYHVIENQEIHQLMSMLISRLPDGLQLVIGSRTVPSLPLARLRMSGQVRDISSADLSFTSDEIAELVPLSSVSSVSPADIQELSSRTDGWIAGIRLALASAEIALPSNATSIIDRWYTRQSLDDFVLEEVLSSLPEELQWFVLQTVPLPYLDVELCNHVLGITSSARLIQEVGRRVIFVRPYGPNHESLAYHSLFAESVMRIASRVMPDADPKKINLRASMWFENRGLLEEAAEQAVLAEAWDRAEPIIHRICQPLVNSDKSDSIWYWLRKLPEDYLLNNPALARWYISSLQRMGEHQKAQEAFETVKDQWRASGNPVHEAYDKMCRITIYAMNGQTDLALAQAHEAVKIVSDEIPLELMQAWSFIYQIAAFEGDDAEADEAYSRAESYRKRLPVDQWYWLNHTEPLRINTEALRGRLKTAEQMYTHKLENLPSDQYHHEGKFRYRRSAIWLEWDNLDQVKAELEHLSQQIQTLPYKIWHPELFLHVAHAYGVLGDMDNMESTLRHIRAMVHERGGDHNLNRLEALEVELWLMTDRRPLAQHWERHKAQRVYTPPLLFGDPDPRLARVKTLLASEDPDQAINDLTAMIREAKTKHRWAELVSLASWHMSAFVMKGDFASARESLHLALQHGQAGGFVRSFQVSGVDLTDFLRETWPLLDFDAATYLSSLIHHGIWNLPGDIPLSLNAALADPLSPRELEVLHLITSHLGNRAIGEQLFISERTVKKHVGSILRKLGCTNRKTAAEHARQLGLIAIPKD